MGEKGISIETWKGIILELAEEKKGEWQPFTEIYTQEGMIDLRSFQAAIELEKERKIELKKQDEIMMFRKKE